MTERHRFSSTGMGLPVFLSLSVLTASTTAWGGWSYLNDDCMVNVWALGYSSITRFTVWGARFPRNGADPTPMIG